jgi:mannose-6-phosphate isomerase-like protein (cupin superfamily)
MKPQQPFLHHASEACERFIDEGCYILEAWNRSADQAVSIARARVRPGVTTRLHRLHGIAERYLVLEGVGRAEVGTLAPRVLTAGDVLFIPPGCPQRITNPGESDLVFLAVCTPRFVPAAYEDIESPS